MRMESWYLTISYQVLRERVRGRLTWMVTVTWTCSDQPTKKQARQGRRSFFRLSQGVLLLLLHHALTRPASIDCYHMDSYHRWSTKTKGLRTDASLCICLIFLPPSPHVHPNKLAVGQRKVTPLSLARLEVERKCNWNENDAQAVKQQQQQQQHQQGHAPNSYSYYALTLPLMYTFTELTNTNIVMMGVSPSFALPSPLVV